MSEIDLINIIIALIIIIIMILLCVILPKLIEGSKKDKEIEDSINNN